MQTVRNLNYPRRKDQTTQILSFSYFLSFLEFLVYLSLDEIFLLAKYNLFVFKIDSCNCYAQVLEKKINILYVQAAETVRQNKKLIITLSDDRLEANLLFVFIENVASK